MRRKLCLLFAISTLSACSTTQYQIVRYTGPQDCYPAVLSVFEDMKVRVKDFNLQSNHYISNRIYNKKLNIKYNIKVTFDNSIIKSSLVDVTQPHEIYPKTWVPYKSFFPLDDRSIRQQLERDILTILNDTKKYQEVKSDILNELGFHYQVASSMTKADARQWITSNMTGKRFKLYLTNYDPEFRLNDTNTAPYKKYIAHFRYNSQKWLTTEFDLDLFTNNANYKSMPLNSHIITLADFIGAEVQIYIVTFGFSFDQLLPET